MWRDYLQRALHWIGHVIRKPHEELDRWQRAARFSYDLGRFGAKQLREDRAPQMAAALSFQVLFALIPLLVVVVSIAQGFWDEDKFLESVNEALNSAGFSQVTVELVPTDGTPKVQTLSDWMYGLIQQAARANLTNWLSYLLIIYAAVSTLVTIENSFNTIYRAPEGRSWARRVPLYWFLVTVSPIAFIFTTVAHEQVDAAARTLIDQSWFVGLVQIAWSIGVGWLFWFVVYSFVPNTTVERRASAVGALVCVLLLELAKNTMGVYLSNVFGVGQFYSSLGLIPLFMFLVYVMWLFILFGLEVSATLQFLGDRTLQEIETRPPVSTLTEPAVVVNVMELVACDFTRGESTPQRRIADQTGLPERVVASIIQELSTAGLLHRLERDPGTVCLAKPPDQIAAGPLMEIGFRLADGAGDRRISPFLERMREHQRNVADAVTLASLLPARS